MNQENINFNKKMLVANTIIQGTQAAISLTNAAVGLGKAIYDNKERQFLQTNRVNLGQVNAGIDEAVAKDFVPYDDNGKYIGFDSFKTRDGRTIGEMRAEIASNASEHFRTDWGARTALENLNTEIVNSELKAQGLLYQRELTRQEQFKINELSDLSESIVMGNIQYDSEGNEKSIEASVRDVLRNYISNPELLELETAKYTNQITFSKIQNDIEVIAKNEGYEAALNHIESNGEKITQSQRAALTVLADGLGKGHAQNLFNQKRADAIDYAAKTGDMSQIDAVYENATWMSREQKDAGIMESRGVAKINNYQQQVLKIAESGGMSAVDEFIDTLERNKDITRAEGQQLRAIAQTTNNQEITAAKTSAIERFNSIKNNGGTIQQAVQAGLLTGSTNSAVNEGVTQEIKLLQEQWLIENHAERMTGITTDTDIETLQEKRDELLNSQGDYSNHNLLFQQTLAGVDNIISLKKAANEETMLDEAINTIIPIARDKGIVEASKQIESMDLNPIQKAQVFSQAQIAANQSEIISNAAASDTFNQSRNNGLSIGDSYRRTMALADESPANANDIKNAARALQYESLSNRFGQELAGSDVMSLEQLETIKTTYENRRSDYQDQGMLYKQHLDAIDNEIARRQAQESQVISNAAMKTEAENIMANLFIRFHNNEESGPVAIIGIDQLRELSPEKAAGYIADIIGRDEKKLNPAAKVEYENLESILSLNKPANNASAEEKIQHEIMSRHAREVIFQAYYDGVRGEELAQLVHGFREEMASEVLRIVWPRGDIGTSGPFAGAGKAVSADEAATAIAYHGNLGNLDLRFSERTIDPLDPSSTIPMTVGGDSVDRVLLQAADNLKAWANDQLSRKGLQMVHTDFPRDERGDRDGRITFTGSDGNKYRVNATAENGSRVLERFDNGRWVNADIANMPNSTSTQAERNQQRQRDEAEIIRLAGETSLPMPPEYTGRVNDLMNRHFFLQEYGLQNYQQFLNNRR
ncbi:MAG: hypothetical protein LBG94_03875 [Treponema sp.]|nr:hypothetical protein [Treponema sp.]